MKLKSDIIPILLMWLSTSIMLVGWIFIKITCKH